MVECFEALNLTPHFYPLNEGLQPVPPDGLRSDDVFLAAHLYGIVVHDGVLRSIAKRCREIGALLIEDCAHLPYPLRSPPEGALQLFSLRKTYAVPHGALLVVPEAEASEFFAYVARQPYRDPGSISRWKWRARETAKRWILDLKIKKKLSGAAGDGSLPSFELSGQNLEDVDWDRAAAESAERRRENARYFLSHLGQFEIKPLPLNLNDDIPYQILIASQFDVAQSLLFSLRENGVSATTGSELSPAILAQLPPDHLYRRWIALPVHPGVTKGAIDHMIRRMRLFFTYV